MFFECVCSDVRHEKRCCVKSEVLAVFVAKSWGRFIKSEVLAVFVAKAGGKMLHQERGFSCVCSEVKGKDAASRARVLAVFVAKA